MEQTTIKDFFAVRSCSEKRKYTPDGEQAPKKVLLLDGEGRVTPKEKLAKRVVRNSKVVSKLTFDEEPPSSTKVVNVQRKTITDVIASRKELSLGQIKNRILKSSRIDELKSRLTRLSDGYNQLKGESKSPQKVTLEDEAAPEKSTLKTPTKNEPALPPSSGGSTLKEFQSIEVTVFTSPVKGSPVKQFTPLSPIKNPLSPIKSPSKVPAYLRFASLASDEPKLTLPYHYRFLGEVFRSVETVVSLLHNRNETVMFSKVKSAVQKTLKRDIGEKQLSQIKHLSPDMYIFTREQVKKNSFSTDKEYELILTPQIFDRFTSEVTLERRRKFFNALVEKVKDHHKSFLQSLDPPMMIQKSKLKRWHPEFNLECIPDVECDQIPEIPNIEKYMTAQDALRKISQKYSDPRVQRAIKMVDEKLKMQSSKIINGKLGDNSSNKEISESRDTFVNPAFKNIPKALLEKVKARQAENALKAMTSVHTETTIAYQKLPELARTLQNLFVVEKKNVLAVDIVLPKLENCFTTNITYVEFLNLLKILTKEVPEWLSICTVRKIDFIKLVKKVDFAKVILKLDSLAVKHRL